MNRECYHEYRSFLTFKILWDKNLSNIISEPYLVWFFFFFFYNKSHQTRGKTKGLFSVTVQWNDVFRAIKSEHKSERMQRNKNVLYSTRKKRCIQFQVLYGGGKIRCKWLSGEIQLIYTRSERSARQSFHRHSHT